MVKQTSFSYSLTAEQQSLLMDLIRGGSYRPAHVPHTKMAVKTPDCGINLYKSGKCLIQGKGAEEFVMYVMEPLVLQQATLGYEDIIKSEEYEDHMGIDESGKGDFFGPLVVVGAFSDSEIVQEMREMGVRDSKSITSDNKALDMGRSLRKLLGKRFAVVKIGPEAYNRLYAKMRNVNTMLAWAHARAIENLLEAVPNCPKAISDQFGSKTQVEKSLMKKGREIELVQRPKAESDIAVAAASVIARELFLRALYDLGKKYNLEIPKGASAGVRNIAIELVKKEGPEVLLQTVKCHFKTTDVVLSETKHNRSELGAEGQAVSKAKIWTKKKKAARD